MKFNDYEEMRQWGNRLETDHAIVRAIAELADDEEHLTAIWQDPTPEQQRHIYTRARELADADEPDAHIYWGEGTLADCRDYLTEQGLDASLPAPVY